MPPTVPRTHHAGLAGDNRPNIPTGSRLENEGEEANVLRRGQLVILVMLLAAMAAAGLAWWHQYRQGVRVLAFWGPDAARRIRLAPQCELWQLTPALSEARSPSDPGVVMDGSGWSLLSQKDISRARGLIHARQALIRDASYDWSAAVPDLPPQWSYGLCFRDGSGQTLLLFDLASQQVGEPDSGKTAHAGSDRPGFASVL